MGRDEMARAIGDWIAWLGDDDVDVEIGGQLFGGRPGEAPQRPRSFELNAETFRMSFNTTERLEVIGPSAVEFGTIGAAPYAGALMIPDAVEVRWGWHYYGRPETPENRCELTYRFAADRVTREASGPTSSGAPHMELRRNGAAAVRLVPYRLRLESWQPAESG